MEYALLGPVEVRHDGCPLHLQGSKQRALLAVLVLHANEVVPAEQLITGLWGESPPVTAPKMVQIFVSQLRRVLEAGDAGARVLVTQSPGYVLRAEPDQVDLRRFELLVAAGYSALPQDPGTASDLFREGLSLWRGSPLSNVAQEPFAQIAVPRLEELRLRTVEERIEADLSVGRHADLVGELKELAAHHPLRERIHGQLMLALYRSGRQAEALELYRRARGTLAEELGIEPGVELQRLHGAILRQDPSLERPPKSAPRPAAQVSESGTRDHHPPAPEPAATTPDARPALSRRRRPLRALLVAGALLAGCAAVTVVLVLVLRSVTPAVSVRPDSVAVVDSRSGRVVSDVPVGTAPGPIAIQDGVAWVGNVDDRTMTGIDLRSPKAVQTLGLSQAPASLTAGEGVVWIGDGYDGTLSRILVGSDQLSAPFFPGRPLSGLLAVATSPGDLWVGLADDSLLRLDPGSLRTKARIALPNRPKAITVPAGAVWLIAFGSNHVSRVDASRGLITAVIRLPATPQAIAAGYGSIWVATSQDDTLWQIDPRRAAVVRSVPLGLPPAAITAGAGAIWVTSSQTGVLERVDPRNAELTMTLNLGHPVGGTAIAGGNLYLTIR